MKEMTYQECLWYLAQFEQREEPMTEDEELEETEMLLNAWIERGV